MEKKTKTLGASITITNLPETADEFDQLAGEVGACIKTAVDQRINHAYLGTIRQIACKKLEEVSEVERQFEEKSNKSGSTVKVYTETENDYVTRLRGLSEAGEIALSIEDIDTTIQEVVDNTEVTWKANERSSSALPRVAKKWLDAADKYIEAGQAEAACDKVNNHEYYDGVELSADMENLKVMLGNALKVIQANVLAKAQQELSL